MAKGVRLLEYIYITLVSALGGTILFLLYRAWFLLLIKFSGKYDIPTRRKIAARWYVLMILMVGMLLLSVVIMMMLIGQKTNPIILSTIFAFSNAPAAIWWIRKFTVLRSLGYGRQKK